MPRQSIHLLLIDDDEDDFLITQDIVAQIRNIDITLEWEPNFDNAIATFTHPVHDVYLIDYRLGAHTGIEVIKEATALGCKAPLILLTGKGDLEIDYEAMQMGASDYLVKGELNASSLERALRYSLRHAQSLIDLEEKERKYRSLFGQSIDAIYITDSKQMLVEGNHSLLELLDYDSSHLQSIYLKDLFVDQNEYSKFYEELKSNDRVKNFETILITKHNKEFYCQINASALIDGEGTHTGYQGIIRDVSDQKRAAQELLMAEKLSTTGQIARSIAHEVRNPLTNLNLALEGLKEELPTDNDSKDLYMGIIQKNANRIEQLISELLNSSKPRQLNLEKTSINEVLEETLLLVQDRIQLRNIQLEKEFHTPLPLVELDREKIKTALLNILINGIEAIEQEPGILQVYSEPTYQGGVAVKIIDNGVGIEAEHLNKLFDPFFTNKHGGMGLGLTSTKNILNSHRAEVNVESTPGKGTCFRIQFN